MSAIVKVTNEGQLDLPPEIRSQLKIGDEYRVIVKEDGIVLEKISKPTVDLDLFLQELEELESDPSELTLQEISEIVKEVRHELWSTK
jgi:bifunctional DNA-binding transcriptional regulator/antitoxin component of YhaV-PrlF toxin-antitoxin module